jgi:hypothetical protein
MLVIAIFVHISSSNILSATKNGLVSVWFAPIAMNSSTVDVDSTLLWGHTDGYDNETCTVLSVVKRRWPRGSLQRGLPKFERGNHAPGHRNRDLIVGLLTKTNLVPKQPSEAS